MNCLLWIWMCTCVFSLADGENCVYQVQGCSCYMNNTWCSNAGLREIPPLVGAGNVTDVSFDMNLITTVPARSLPPNIQQLSMNDNPIVSIDDSAFDDSINTLEILIFSSANFTRIPNALGRLLKLQQFHLFSTRILDWNEDVMMNIGATVQSLILQDCNVKSWPLWLKNFHNLTELTLAYNLISDIPDDGLDTLANTLTSLDLQNNSLSSVPKALSKMIQLQSLYLEENRITDVTWLPTHAKLFALYLNSNKIYDTAQLSKALVPYADTLLQFNIDNNALTSIPNISFLTKMTDFYISSNRISDSLSGALPYSTFSLILNNNNLRTIPKVFMTLKNVTEISLTYNLLTQIRDIEFPPWTVGGLFGFNFITELTDTSFPVNCSLMFLDINNNPIHAISNLAFQNVPHLSYLNLEATKLSRLPLGLLSGKSLTGVDFLGSDDLVCTCAESGLTKWINSLPDYAITGNCGRTTVEEFFRLYASACQI